MSVSDMSLSDAIVVWTGFGSAGYPMRDRERLTRVIGVQRASELLPEIQEAASQFYESDARYKFADLVLMGKAAAARFRTVRPDISEEAVRALIWCYTFDYK